MRAGSRRAAWRHSTSSRMQRTLAGMGLLELIICAVGVIVLIYGAIAAVHGALLTGLILVVVGLVIIAFGTGRVGLFSGPRRRL